MKRTAILTVTLSAVLVAFCANGFADDLAAQVNLLEQKAARIQTHIDQAKKQSSAALDPQVKQLQATIEALIQQRVQIDGQIASLEQKIHSLQTTAQTTLTTQVERYDNELAEVKQQLASLAAKRAARNAAKPPEVKKPAATIPPTPAKQTPAAPASDSSPNPAQSPAPMSSTAPAGAAAAGPINTN